MKLKNKELLKKSLEASRKTLEQVNAKKAAIESQKDKVAKDAKAALEEQKFYGGTKTMKLTKNIRSDLFLIKTYANVLGKDVAQAVKEYGEATKTMEALSDHGNILNDVKTPDFIPEFDARDKELLFINRFTKVDMLGKNKRQLVLESEDMILKHVGEGSDAPDATWDESLLDIQTSRGALAFLISKELQSKTIVDQLTYVRSKTSTVVGRGVLELVYNGQGSSPQVDNGYAADGMGKKGAGLRAILAANSYVSDFAAAAPSRTNMATFLKAAGALFAQRQSQYVMIVCLRDHQTISDLVRGNGVTGVNDTKADDSIYAPKFMGVELHQTAFLKSPVASGSGYDETGFVSATDALNDHSVILLINPSKVFWALDELEVSAQYIARKNQLEVVINCQLGCAFHKAELGIMGINVGANIGADPE